MGAAGHRPVGPRARRRAWPARRPSSVGSSASTTCARRAPWPHRCDRSSPSRASLPEDVPDDRPARRWSRPARRRPAGAGFGAGRPVLLARRAGATASRSWWSCRRVGLRGGRGPAGAAGRGRAGRRGPGRGRRGGAAGEPAARRRCRSWTRWTPAAVLAAERVAVEVAGGGQPLRVLTDPLQAARRAGARRAGARRRGRSWRGCSSTPPTPWSPSARPVRGADDVRVRAWIEVADRGRLPFLEGHELVRAGPVGEARRVRAAAGLREARGRRPVGGRPGRGRGRRPGPGRRGQPAARHAGRAAVDGAVRRPGGGAGRAPRRPGAHGRVGGQGRVGPGRCRLPVRAADRVVVDLGGGTIDIVSATDARRRGRGRRPADRGGRRAHRCHAGCRGVGQARAGVPGGGAAGAARRGRHPRLPRPSGRRATTVGRLVVPGPAGLLPFSRTMAPGEWRALRVRLKVELVGGNVARGLRTLGETPPSVVVVGGLAGDDEILGGGGSGALPAGTAVGRGDVGREPSATATPSPTACSATAASARAASRNASTSAYAARGRRPHALRAAPGVPRGPRRRRPRAREASCPVVEDLGSHLGVELHGRARRAVAKACTPQPLRATTRAPGGGSSTSVWNADHGPAGTSAGSSVSTRTRPTSGAGARHDPAAERVGDDLGAVAEAEHRHADATASTDQRTPRRQAPPGRPARATDHSEPSSSTSAGLPARRPLRQDSPRSRIHRAQQVGRAARSRSPTYPGSRSVTLATTRTGRGSRRTRGRRATTRPGLRPCVARRRRRPHADDGAVGAEQVVGVLEQHAVARPWSCG